MGVNDSDADTDATFVRRYTDVWNEPDAEARSAAVAALLAEPSDAGTRATAEELLRRLGAGDPDAVAHLFAEKVDWRLDWPAAGHPAVPWVRPRSTRADVADHFRELWDAHVPQEGPAPTVLVDGADAVVLTEIRQTVRATGVPYTAMCALRLTVDDGLITAYHVYEDSLTVATALTAC